MATAVSPRAPQPRDDQPVVTVNLRGKHEGLHAVCRTRFKAKRLADLGSGDMDRILAALTEIVVSHNFPDADDPGMDAESLGDVELSVLTSVIGGLTEEMAALPNS